MASLLGQVFLVTGANAGLGLEVVRGLIRSEATVVLACRSLDRARDAVKNVEKDMRPGKGELVSNEHWLLASA